MEKNVTANANELGFQICSLPSQQKSEQNGCSLILVFAVFFSSFSKKTIREIDDRYVFKLRFSRKNFPLHLALI